MYYLKPAWRSLLKYRFHTGLNIIGLSIGLASCLIITLYIRDELHYDRFIEHADRIYRIDADIKFGAETMSMATVSSPLATVLYNDYPQVEVATRMLKRQHGAIVRRTNEPTNQKEANVVFADSTLLEMFPLPVIAGDAKTALIEPHTVVLTETAAKKYFGSQYPLNQTLIVDNDVAFRVSAVVADIPLQSHLAGITMFFSMASYPGYNEADWVTHSFTTYIRLQSGVSQVVFEENLDTVIEQYAGTALQQNFGVSLNQFKEAGNSLRYSLFPLMDIHLHSNKTGEVGANGNANYVYTFCVVALFLLIIACVNFMNLATARSTTRVREVGVRKVLGSTRKPLVIQFLVESTILSYLALGLAVIVATLALPFFNDLAAKQLTIPYQAPIFWLSLLIGGTLVGLLAGSYPAFFLSGFKPLYILKGVSNSTNKGWSLRNFLVVFQFTVSIVLIAGTGIIYHQLHYIQSKPLGFNKDQLLIISDTQPLQSNAQSFKQAVQNLAAVERMSWSGYLPTPSNRRNDIFFPQDGSVGKNGINMQTWWVDADYVATLDLQVVSGRNFSDKFPTDSSGVIFNEAAIKLLGYANPTGQNVKGLVDNQVERPFTIVGVVNDFHFESLRDNIAPLALLLRQDMGAAIIRIHGGDIQQTVRQVETLWKEYAKGHPFDYYFMDEAFNQVYRIEQQMGRVFIIFTSLSIFIACLGLFGLATFTAERRFKEISIRKVLGASATHIVQMLSADFVKLVLIAVAIACPLAWWVMTSWLENFAYRITIEWWIFAAAGLIAFMIALLTVSGQAIRAAVANPVDSLRGE